MRVLVGVGHFAWRSMGILRAQAAVRHLAHPEQWSWREAVSQVRMLQNEPQASRTQLALPTCPQINELTQLL